MASKDSISAYDQLHVNISYFELPDPKKYKKHPDMDYFTTSANITMVTPRQKARWKGYQISEEQREQIGSLIEQMYDAVDQIMGGNDEA